VIVRPDERTVLGEKPTRAELGKGKNTLISGKGKKAVSNATNLLRGQFVIGRRGREVT